jgi:3-phenylpropionate/cinnamic acid dioxygenase small subunit
LPLAPIVAESRGALEDRVIAIRKTMVYAPRTVIHAACGVRILAEEGDSLRTRSVFSVHQTLIDGVTHLQMVGRSFDRIEMHADGWRFAERIAVYDTELIPGSVVYPV